MRTANARWAALATATLLLGLCALVASPRAQASAPGCSFLSAPSATAAFCDTFDAPAGTGNRSGDLNGTVWGVSRRGQENSNQGMWDEWYTTQLNLCGTTVTVMDPQDVRICQGHLVEALNDGGGCCAGGAAALFMYPKQPFDFAGRTGTVAFDVSNDSQGPHAAWPEFWITDQPTPVPFSGMPIGGLAPRNGFGIQFFGHCGTNGWNVGSVTISTNYDTVDTFTDNSAPQDVNNIGCVTMASAAANTLNHVELRISRAQTDVYATNAYSVGSTPGPLVHVATITTPNMPLTRGLIWIGDGHYNGCKAPGTQCVHTFYWDDVAFDGPVLPQDRTFDVLDAQAPKGPDGGTDEGWNVNNGTGSVPTLQTVPVDAQSISQATGAMLMFNLYSESGFSSISAQVNGHTISASLPFSEPTEETFAMPVPLADVVAGANTISFSNPAIHQVTIFNVDLLLIGAGGTPGGPTPTPTDTATPIPPTATPTVAPTATPTDTPTPVPTPTPEPIDGVPCVVTLDGVPQSGTCSGTFTPGS